MIEQRPAEHYIRVCRQRSDPDWEHAPLLFKLYRHCERLPLSMETLTALSREQDPQPLFSLGLLLHDIYGIMRMKARTEAKQDLSAQNLAAFSSASSHDLPLYRTVASGGARYPCELYLLVNSGQNLAEGLYHYDPAHHALDRLRTGSFTRTLLGALAQPPIKQPDYTLLFSSLFWKDAFKYQEFSYRLQGLDLGCLLAQTQMVCERAALRPSLHFRFLDHQLNQLLGLDFLKESIYAVITLETDHSEATAEANLQPDPDWPPVNELPPTVEQYEPLSRWPLLAAVHRASCNETRADMDPGQDLPPLAFPAVAPDLAIALPSVLYTHQRAYASNRRSAPPLEFRPRPLTLRQLALLLQTGQKGYQGDLDDERSGLAQTLLYCVINHVEDVPPGVYVYQAKQHLLRQVREGEFQQLLQVTQSDPGVFADALSLCVIPVGNYARGFPVYGDRWYRMQNMQAGMVVQRLYLTSAMSDLGCRASLGFLDERMNRLLDLPDDYTSLCQVLISPLAATARDYSWHAQSMTW